MSLQPFIQTVCLDSNKNMYDVLLQSCEARLRRFIHFLFIASICALTRIHTKGPMLNSPFSYQYDVVMVIGMVFFYFYFVVLMFFLPVLYKMQISLFHQVKV